MVSEEQARMFGQSTMALVVYTSTTNRNDNQNNNKSHDEEHDNALSLASQFHQLGFILHTCQVLEEC